MLRVDEVAEDIDLDEMPRWIVRDADLDTRDDLDAHGLSSFEPLLNTADRVVISDGDRRQPQLGSARDKFAGCERTVGCCRVKMEVDVACHVCSSRCARTGGGRYTSIPNRSLNANPTMTDAMKKIQSQLKVMPNSNPCLSR